MPLPENWGWDEDRHRIRADRWLMEYALRLARARVSYDSVKCPFHRDEKASGSIYEVRDKGRRAWLFTCHADCGWNTPTVNQAGKRPHQSPSPGRTAFLAKGAHGEPKSTGDAIAVVRRKKQLGFVAAIQVLLEACEHRKELPAISWHAPESEVHPSIGLDPVELKKVEESAASAHERLLSDPAALEQLWRTRAIDKATVQRFGLGIDGKPGRRFWTMPVRDGRTFVARKAHAIEGGQSKCWWWPVGAGSKWAWPVALDDPGVAFLAPGELKAIGITALGRPALGITCGETCELPAIAVQLLRGRAVAIVADADDTGRSWAVLAQQRLRDAGIDAVALDLCLPAGHDIGDWLVEHRVRLGMTTAAVGALLDEAYDRARSARATATPPVQTTDVSAALPEPVEQPAGWLSSGVADTQPESPVPGPEACAEPGVLESPTMITADQRPGQPASPGLESSQSPTDRAREPLAEKAASADDDPGLLADEYDGKSLGELLACSDTWEPVQRVLTGIRALDELLDGGLRRGHLHLLVGKPKACKSQLVTQIALNAASAGIPVAVITLEMPGDEIARLALAQTSGITRRELADGIIGYQPCLGNARARLKNAPLRIYDDRGWPGGLSCERLAELVAVNVRRHGLGLVVLDYVGLLVPHDSDRLTDTALERRQSAALRQVARETGIALLAVAAVRKGAIFKGGPRAPKPSPLELDDVRGSTGFAYDAATVISVAKDYRPGSRSWLLCHVLANRYGPQHDPRQDAPLRIEWQPECGGIGMPL